MTKSLWIVTLGFYSKTTSLKGITTSGEKLCNSCKKQAVIKSEHNLLVNESKDATADVDEDIITAGSSRLCTEILVQKYSTEILPGSTYIACQYDRKWWVGMLKDKSEDFDNYLITFMTSNRLSKEYFWPEKQDTCWIEKANIVCTLPSPDITSTRGYSFSKSKLQRAEAIFNQINKNFK